MFFSADETSDVGSESGTPITDDLTRRRPCSPGVSARCSPLNRLAPSNGYESYTSEEERRHGR